MLKRHGVKRTVVVAKTIGAAKDAADYRIHVRPDIPDTAEPMTMLAKIGAMVATAINIARNFLESLPMFASGRRGKRLLFKPSRHQFFLSIFPHMCGRDLALPTKPVPGALFGREAHRAQRRRFRDRFKTRVCYGKVPVPLRPEGEYGENLRAGAVKHVMSAAIRAGIMRAPDKDALGTFGGLHGEVLAIDECR